jgi:hypothetical protein
MSQCGEAERLALRQQAWQESRGCADWVIVVDCDEFLWHPDLPAYLAAMRRQGVTVPRTCGYEMISPHFPSAADQIYCQVRTGIRADHMDKLVVFDPSAVATMNFTVGCHGAHPEGKIVHDPAPQLKLLHYRHLGLEYVLSRYRQLGLRRTEIDYQMGWNYHYTWPEQEIARFHTEAIGAAKEIVPPP